MKVQAKPIDSIRPYPGNPRLNDDAVDAVAESIRRFGFRQPIVVDAEGVVVAGHPRVKAVRKLGLDTVPVPNQDSSRPRTSPPSRSGRIGSPTTRPPRGPSGTSNCSPSSSRRWPPAGSTPRASASIRTRSHDEPAERIEASGMWRSGIAFRARPIRARGRCDRFSRVPTRGVESPLAQPAGETRREGNPRRKPLVHVDLGASVLEVPSAGDGRFGAPGVRGAGVVLGAGT